MKHFIQDLKPYKWQIIGLLALTLIMVFATLAVPTLLADIINIAIPNLDKPMLWRIAGLMLLFTCIEVAANLGLGFLATKISAGFSKNLRLRVFTKVQYLSQEEMERFSSSSLISRSNNDVEQVQQFVSMFLRMSLMSPIMAVGGVILALRKSTQMSLILLIIIPIMVLFIVTIAKLALPLTVQLQKKLDRINLIIREKLHGLRVTRTFGTEEYEEQRFYTTSLDHKNLAIKMQNRFALFTPGLNLILYGSSVILMAFGAKQIMLNNAIPIGDLVAVIQYIIQILLSIMSISFMLVMYPRAAVSGKRIIEVLDSRNKIQNKPNAIQNIEGDVVVEYKNVSFAFPDAQSPALQNISFVAKPGQTTAFIGSTGSGKSTLVQLLPRFFDVSEGEILWNGNNIQNIDLATLRQNIGYIPQKANAFAGSIAQNIALGSEHMEQSTIEKAAKVAQAFDFIIEKDHGFESELSQGGKNLSGGQRQRLAIARAIAKQAPLYIFDDSFSALDVKTDANLRRALKAELQNACILIVAQRVSTIQNADQIIVLEEGKCVGIGSHKELLENCTVYQEIVQSQSQEGTYEK